VGMTRSRSGAAWNGVIAWGWTVACGLPLARGVFVGFGVPGGRREPPPTDGAVEAGGWSPELVGCPGVVGRPRSVGNALGVTVAAPWQARTTEQATRTAASRASCPIRMAAF